MNLRLRSRPLQVAIALLLVVVVVVGKGIAETGEEVIDAQRVLPEFQALIPQLKRSVEIRVALPTYYPTDALVYEPGTEELTTYLNVPTTQDGQFENTFPYIVKSDEDEYEISLDAAEDCMGANACSFGYISGKRVYFDTPSIDTVYAFHKDPDYQPSARSPEADQFGSVTLVNGTYGYFVPFICGASCDTSKIIWDDDEVRYIAGIRYASKDAVLRMANSMIQNRIPRLHESTPTPTEPTSATEG